MPRARLRLTLPEDSWLGKLSKQYPDEEFRVLTVYNTGTEVVGIMEVKIPDLSSIRRHLDDIEQMASYQVLHTDGNRELVEYSTLDPKILHAALASGIVPVYPVSIQNGTMFIDSTTSQDRLSRFGNQLDAEDVPYEVVSMSQSSDQARLLTDRQRRFVLEAVKRGYYAVPRRCTLTDLAAGFDVSKSAASGILHRAEGRIIENYVAGLGEDTSAE